MPEIAIDATSPTPRTRTGKPPPCRAKSFTPRAGSGHCEQFSDLSISPGEHRRFVASQHDIALVARPIVIVCGRAWKRSEKQPSTRRTNVDYNWDADGRAFCAKRNSQRIGCLFVELRQDQSSLLSPQCLNSRRIVLHRHAPLL
jgi:hypothetical protein